ncbi:MAG: hypothetical protein NXI31_01740 [bacterium]|nr:hypothetical protein [bacterium]
MSPSHSTRRASYSLAGLAICTLAACANVASPRTRLPFHIAVMPAVTDDSLAATAAESAVDGDASAIELTIDAAAFTDRLVDALGSHCCRVTLLPATTDPAVSLQLAQAAGADVILGTMVRYDREVATGLNARFLPNLALFAIGGPLNWFVSDRSYYYSVEFESQLHDVAIAATRSATLDPQSRLARLPGTANEAALNFMARADNPSAFLLSLLLPAGFIGSESEATPAALQEAVGVQLCQLLTGRLQECSGELTGPRALVSFAPADVRLVGEGDHRALVGAFVLELGEVDDLGGLRYRFDDGEFQDVSWESSVAEVVDEVVGRKRYAFRIPLPVAAIEFVQLEVEQLDAFASRRTFTFSAASVMGGEQASGTEPMNAAGNS